MVGLAAITATKPKGLQHYDQGRQTHGELREEIMKGDGECEMNTMNQKRTIHEKLPGVYRLSILPGA